MNKTDTILERLKEQPQPIVDHPDELTDSIMGSLPEPADVTKASTTRRLRLYAISAIAVAASVLLLLVFLPGKDIVEREPVAVLQTPQAQPPMPAPPVPKDEEEVKQVAAAQPTVTPTAKPNRRKAKPQPSTDDVPMETPASPMMETPASPIEDRSVAIVIPDPTEQILREFHEQTASIRRRGEQVTHQVAMLQRQHGNNPQYIEL